MLQNDRVRLEPLAHAHAHDLAGVVADGELWRAAIERLGAKQDGVLRNHRIMPDGHLRDTVVYSIIDAEWPAVRRGLEARIR